MFLIILFKCPCLILSLSTHHTVLFWNSLSSWLYSPWYSVLRVLLYRLLLVSIPLGGEDTAYPVGHTLYHVQKASWSPVTTWEHHAERSFGTGRVMVWSLCYSQCFSPSIWTKFKDSADRNNAIMSLLKPQWCPGGKINR